MNSARLAVLLCAALAAAACSPPGGAPSGGPGKASRVYRVGVRTVEPRPLEYAIEAVGTLEAYDVAQVPARVAGTLESLSFDEGDVVTTAQVLAVVDGRRFEMENDMAKAVLGRVEASVESAGARTRQAEAALGEAGSALERRRGLREKNPGWVTADELSALESAVKRCSATVEEARAGEKTAAAQVQEARAGLDLAGKNVEDARVRSPIAGIIESRRVAVGQYVKAGDVIATLVDPSRLRVRFRVGEAESVRLSSGQPVEFSVAAFPGRSLKAEIFHVSATADPSTRMVECLAAVKEPEKGLRPGFFATVRAVVSRSGEAVVVPSDAVLPTEAGFTAFVVEDGKARARTLRLGLQTKDGGIEVLSGLARGDVLAVEGATALQDGVPVAVDAPGAAAPGAAPKTGGKE
jgi:multidrug efflux system membrane fusion protein